MKKFKKLFGEYELSYKKVIIFAIITGVFTGLINSVPFLLNTSFRDIAISFEWWIIFAIFIIVNCKTPKEACIKCFIFFLISQPLVYLVEVPFVSEGFGVFRYYKYWFIWTILTIPGSLICFQLKRKNLLSVAILSVTTFYYAYMFVNYTNSVIYNFPYHLLSALLCLVSAIILPIILFDNKKYKYILYALFIVTSIILFIITNNNKQTSINLNPELSYSYTIEDESLVDVNIKDNKLQLKAKKTGLTYLYLSDEKGNMITYVVTVTSGNIFVNVLD